MEKYKTHVVAHRGAWKNTNLPENSAAALKAAIASGYYGSEMDVHMTSDGHIVVNHDPHFNGIDIQNSSLAELRKFKLSNGEELPLLSDFLKVIAKQKKTRLILEIKTSQRGKEWGLQTAKAVTDQVKKYKASSMTDYISFGFDICEEILKYVPDAEVQYLNGDKSPAEVKAAGIKGIDYHYTVFQKHPEYISDSKKLGILTNAWTVNDQAAIDWLIAHEVDFITTNEPELCVERIMQAPVSNGYKLVWSDEFIKNGLPDPNNWQYETGGGGWGNNELQYYTKEDSANAIVKNGVLHIIARKQNKENRGFTSARLVTRGKGAWTYGRIEARIKLPTGIGLWPAFWMLGNNIDKVGWPACGEIDIMEHVGYRPDDILGTIHTQSFNHLKGTQNGGEVKIDKPYDTFNTFAVEWDKDRIRFLMNDQEYHTFRNTGKGSEDWPFDKPFFIILNLAVGGNLGGVKGVNDSAFPATYSIDYVRVYQKPDHKP